LHLPIPRAAESVLIFLFDGGVNEDVGIEYAVVEESEDSLPLTTVGGGNAVVLNVVGCFVDVDVVVVVVVDVDVEVVVVDDGFTDEEDANADGLVSNVVDFVVNVFVVVGKGLVGFG